MRFFVSFYIILSAFRVPGGLAQSVNFEDGFEDGDFTSDPAWSGTTDDFIISNVDDNYLLQLDANSAGTSYLSTPSANTEGTWEFYIHLDGFAPSNNNNASIYLMSDTADLTGQVNGYALQAGENLAGDVFRLFKITNGTKDGEILTGTTNISAGGEYRVKISRDLSGNWALEVGTGYAGTLNQEDTGTNNDYTSASYFGFVTNYTSSNTNKFGFDFKIDLPPFAVTEARVNANEVDVAFNRAYDSTSVHASDFSINNGIGTPPFVSFPGTDTIRLIYDNPLPGGEHMLTVQNIEDQNGEEIIHDVSSLIVFGSFTPGDVIINEFVYDPPSGVAEYVELKNTSDKYLDIKNWTLGDNTALNIITNDTRVLKPDHFLVISSDTTTLFNAFGHIPYVQMNTFPALNNTGDAIRIISLKEETADSLTYTPDWGGTGVALERRSGFTPAIYPENWGDAPDGTGSPGKPNTIPQDKTAPEFEELTIISDSSIHLKFSERIEAGSAVTKSNFTINPHREVEFISARHDTITLHLSQKLQSGQSYQITVENLQDIFGNTMHPATREETYIKFVPAGKSDVVFNEILYTRENSGDPEFIELYNTTGKNFDLSGWRLGDAAGTVTLDPGIHLQAGGYLVLTDNAAFADSSNNVRYVTGFPSLNDAGDALYLRTDNGLTVDSLFYLSTWGETERGTSLERRDPLAASNDPSNWQPHPTPGRYSPGMANASFRPDDAPPEPIFSKLLPGGSIEAQFSEFIRLTPDLSFFMGERQLPVTSFDPDQANRITLQSSHAKTGSRESALTLTVQNLTDIRGNTLLSAEIPVARRLESGSVVINEIMYNPLSEPDDNLPNQSEYVELRNTKDHAISLEGLYLHDAPDENGEVRSLVPVTTAAGWIPAQGIALIYADEATDFKQSQIANFFEISDHNPASTIRVNRSTLSLASSGDAVYLADSTGAVIDSVYYDESWQNPNLIDTRGIALERIDPSGPGNDRTNWSSSTSEKGGTPHAENTLYQVSGSTPDQAGISFSPNPFSPDNDGYDDNLFISYKLDEADYLMKVHIYDRYGRLVRRLADGQPAGYEGSLIWDGRKDNGTRNRIGIYIVVFEAFNSINGKNRAFKKTVVLARRFN